MSKVLDRIYLLNEQITLLRSKIDLLRNERNKLMEENAEKERKRITMKLALRRIAESVVAWKEEEANSLLETIGNVANQAIKADEEGWYK